MSSRVQELVIHTRKHPACGYLISLESILSYPIPVWQGEISYLRFFVYQRGLAEKGDSLPIYPPHAEISIEFPSGRFMEYRDLSTKEETKSIGEYPHAAIAQMSVKSILDLQKELYILTEEILHLLSRTQADEAERKSLARYKELVNILFEPSLRSYYRKLNEELFRWLDS